MKSPTISYTAFQTFKEIALNQPIEPNKLDMLGLNELLQKDIAIQETTLLGTHVHLNPKYL
jgi:hypothetical protein